jgi:Protein of unknown function (DUF2975)
MKRRQLFIGGKVLTNSSYLTFNDFPGPGELRYGGSPMFAITTKRLGEIQRASRWLLGFFIFISVLSVWATLAGIAHPFPPGTRTLAGVLFQGTAITGKIQILWLVQVVLTTALNLKILYHFIRLTGLFSKGTLFTAQNVAQMRQVGLTFVCWPAVWLVVLIGAAPEIAAAQDQWVKIMQSFPGGAVMGALVFLFVSRLMNEARELRDEQDLVV